MRLSPIGTKRAREAAARKALLDPPPKQRASVKYDAVLARKICRLIASGHPVSRICRMPDMPHSWTVFS